MNEAVKDAQMDAIQALSELDTLIAQNYSELHLLAAAARCRHLQRRAQMAQGIRPATASPERLLTERGWAPPRGRIRNL